MCGQRPLGRRQHTPGPWSLAISGQRSRVGTHARFRGVASPEIHAPASLRLTVMPRRALQFLIRDEVVGVGGGQTFQEMLYCTIKSMLQYDSLLAVGRIAAL